MSPPVPVGGLEVSSFPVGGLEVSSFPGGGLEVSSLAMGAPRRSRPLRGRVAFVLAALLGAGLAACAGVPSAPADGPSLTERLEAPGARVLWIGAHPDDETLAGPILARACIGLGRPCHFFVLTRGEGGRCPFRLGCVPDLGAVRARELAQVAAAYGAELELHAFANAPLPEASFPPRREIARLWARRDDPARLMARTIRRFRPTVILTFEPEHGFTDHPEHQLASRYAMEAVRRAADPSRVGLGSEPPHRVEGVYQVLNHFWITRLLGRADPATPTERFDTHVPCGPPGRACLDVALEITRLHRTQVADMGLVRSLRPQMGTFYLRRVDPWTEPTPAADAE